MPAETIRFTVNGVERSVEVEPMARLLDVLREQLGLTGAKEGCGEGECGACAVLIDGDLCCSCLVPAGQVAGCQVKTVEGLAIGDDLAPIQQAFLEHGGAQCGICTPGMLLAAEQLLDRRPDPSDEDLRQALAGNLCRCTGYTRIFAAVLAAAKVRRDAKEERRP